MTTSPLLRGPNRTIVLAASVLSWMLCGFILAVPPLITSDAVGSMGVTDKQLQGQWFAWYVAAFLFGAATGGFAFGWLGDRIGRAKALGLSVLTFSLLAGLCYFVQTPGQLLVMWFFVCTGVGGVWPNGISLASETLPGASRPWLSGIFGTAVNLGIMAFSATVYWFPTSEAHWRWILLVCASPAVLGVLILAVVPESPAWLLRRRHDTTSSTTTVRAELFRPPLLKLTVIGVLLGTVPQMGAWGATNWLVPWAKEVQKETKIEGLSASTQWMKSSGAAIGALLGGWVANFFGRRFAYFLISLTSLSMSLFIFYSLSPTDKWFLTWVFIQGFVITLFFGWLPLYLPELFPTRVRATGIGVAFNWGRIATAFGVLMSSQLFAAFGGSYARVGQVTCLVYGLGMLIICFSPDTSQKRLNE